MANYEFSKYVTIGRYFPGQSRIHLMDARVKWVCFIIWLFLLSLLPSIFAVSMLTVCVIAMFGVARVSLTYGLSGIRPMIPVMVVMLVFELLFARTGNDVHVMWGAGPIRITDAGIALAAISLLRFLAIVWLVSLFSMTTSTSTMTYALWSLLHPLEKWKVPVTDLVMIFTLAFRFVPIFAEEAERIVKAQAARGADFGTLKWWQIGRRIKSVVPILVPMFVNALDRTEHVAMAMEVRGYRPGRARSSYVQFVSKSGDTGAMLLTILLAGVAVWMTYGVHLI